MGYQTTADFVKQFQNYVKTLKVCDNDHLSECFDTSFYVDGKEITIDKVKTSSNLGKDYNDNNMGVVFANGVSAIITYDPGCNVVGMNFHQGMACIGVMYDLNGPDRPNKISEDIGFINASLYEGLTVADLVSMGCSNWGTHVRCGYEVYDSIKDEVPVDGSPFSSSNYIDCNCASSCESTETPVSSCIVQDSSPS